MIFFANKITLLPFVVKVSESHAQIVRPGYSCLSQHVDECPQRLLGQCEGDIPSLCIRQQEGLLNGVDMEDAAQVDEELTSETLQEPLLPHGLLYRLSDLGHTEGQHEMQARLVIYMGIVVVSLHVQYLFAVDDEKFIVQGKTDAHSHSVKSIISIQVNCQGMPHSPQRGHAPTLEVEGHTIIANKFN